MKKINLLLYALTYVLFMGSCSDSPETKGDLEDDLTPNLSSSTLVVKAGMAPTGTKSANVTAGESADHVVFTGDDILWFNETTDEIRFKENFYQLESIVDFFHTGIEFFLYDEFLFTTLVCVSDINSQVFNVPVFYYSQIENKFFIKDGYPVISVLKNDKTIQQTRDENMQAIAEEWDKFIQYLKDAGKYKK